MAQYDPNCEQFPDLPYAVIHNGIVISYLNPGLIRRNGLTQAEVDKLKALHCELYEVYLKMEATDDPAELKTLFKETTRIETAQQKLWKFVPSENFHYWFEVPKCLCARLDNMERLGTPYRIISSNCPVHGND